MNIRSSRGSAGTVLVLLFLAVLVFFLFAAVGYYLAHLWLEGPLPPPSKKGEAEAARGPGPVLLLGLDRRYPQEPCRSDTIILVLPDPQEKRIALLSIPRDTRVRIPGYGMDKINSAYAYGEEKLLLRTLNSFLGAEIRDYVTVDFKGFQKIIDLLGGVELEVEKRIYYPEEGIDLYPGRQRLSGYNALAYVRFRGDPEGDLGRIRRQQKFLKALLEQVWNWNTIPKLPQLLAEGRKHVKTNMEFQELLSWALYFKDIDSSRVSFYTPPGEGQYIGGINYFLVDEREMSRLLRELPPLR
ncbi:MAG TPA: LytR family transcriptional regulator [Moorella mulderi]|nr:LytR family transcriptional regulator [Moorella mulderi]